MDDKEFEDQPKMKKLLGKIRAIVFCSFILKEALRPSTPIDKIPARLVLYFLSWSGFLVSFVMRNDINLAIVEMVRNPASGSDLRIINGTEDWNATEASLIDPATIPDDGKFDWSNSVQSFIVSSFYLFYVVSQVRKITSSVTCQVIITLFYFSAIFIPRSLAE